MYGILWRSANSLVGAQYLSVLQNICKSPNPSLGAALQTLYTVGCDGWVSDSPLSYRVETISGREIQVLRAF